MLDRQSFEKRFGRKAVFGMIHLAPLPGAPLYGGSMDAVIESAVRDGRAIVEGGCDGFAIENFGDRPFRKNRVDPETIAALTRVVVEVTRAVTLPFGVNVLRNDALAALGIAAATGASFIRVNIHTGSMFTDQGLVEGEAAETLRRRAALAPGMAIFADHLVKHAVPAPGVDAVQSAKDLRLRGLADALIISGRATGAAPDGERLELLRDAVDAPILIGSGLSEENAHLFASADGAIVGTWIKREGRVDEPVDPERCARLVRAFKR